MVAVDLTQSISQVLDRILLRKEVQRKIGDAVIERVNSANRLQFASKGARSGEPWTSVRESTIEKSFTVKTFRGPETRTYSKKVATFINSKGQVVGQKQGREATRAINNLLSLQSSGSLYMSATQPSSGGIGPRVVSFNIAVNSGLIRGDMTIQYKLPKSKDKTPFRYGLALQAPVTAHNLALPFVRPIRPDFQLIAKDIEGILNGKIR